MSIFDALIVYIIDPLLGLLWFLVLISVIMSWLISFNVVNTQNQFVSMVWRLTSAVTEPLLRPIRSVIPTLGGLDFSPIILLLLIGFVRGYVLLQLMRLL